VTAYVKLFPFLQLPEVAGRLTTKLTHNHEVGSPRVADPYLDSSANMTRRVTSGLISDEPYEFDISGPQSLCSAGVLSERGVKVLWHKRPMLLSRFFDGLRGLGL
jgi:hypothetical protein